MDPTLRFSTRVENYIKYRPGYPQAVVDTLRAECHLRSDSTVVDMGSGTGKLAELFLKNGNRVYGVEPNPEMRQVAERLLKTYPKFVSIAARAELTTLQDQCADFVTAGQSFHWFDLEQARSEFSRVLKPGGWVVLIWNERKKVGTPFRQAYERLIDRYDIEPAAGRQRKNLDLGAIRSFFGREGFRLKVFPNSQVFELEGLKGRLLSASYTPNVGHPNYEPMLADLEEIFHQHQEAGMIRFEYNTKMYYGQLI